MAINEESRIGQYLRQKNNPAAPQGQRQAADAAHQYVTGVNTESKLGQRINERGYVNSAQSWYSGANFDGTNNGWDNDFVQRFIAGQERAAEEGSLRSYFEQEDATGVVTWDSPGTDIDELGRQRYRFGDIYDNGKYVGNVYDDYDEDTANLMMSTWTLSGEQRSRAFQSGNPQEGLRQEIRRAREENAKNYVDQQSALEFQGKVQSRAEDIQRGAWDEVVAGGGGAAGGALTGAGIGAFVGGPVGAGIGAAIGGGIGAIGGLFNKDQITTQMAYAYERTALRNAEDSWLAAWGEGTSQWFGVAGRLASPVSNLTQGLYDLTAGELGDLESEFYRRDAEGDRVAPRWLQVADFGAQVVDMGLLMASPLGARAYLTQMGGQIGGNVSSLVLGGGTTFDDRTGQFDNIFTNDDGRFDPLSAAAGIGYVAIDAVQMGTARGLMAKTDAARRAMLGEQAGHYAKKGESAIAQKLASWRGRPEGAVSSEVLAGVRFWKDKNGKVLESQLSRWSPKRLTIQMVAPSEQLTYISAKMIARRRAAKSVRGEGTTPGVVSGEDLYAAARELAGSESKLRNTLITGFGEGYEELWQGVLEPLSHGASIDGEEVIQSFYQGLAGGLGMGIGTQAKMVSQADRGFAKAQVTYSVVTGGAELTREEYDAMPEPQQRMWQVGNKVTRSISQTAGKKAVKEMAHQTVAGVAGWNRVVDAQQTELAKQLLRANPATDQYLLISQVEDPAASPGNSVTSSFTRVMKNLLAHGTGLEVQRQNVQRDLEKKLSEAGLQPEDTELQAQAQALQAELDDLTLTLTWHQRIVQEMAQLHQQLMTAAPSMSAEQISADIATYNDFLRRVFNMEEEMRGGTGPEGEPLTDADRLAMAKAVSLRFSRDPFDQGEDFHLLVPQISVELTREETDGLLLINHSILSGLSGDFDGDRIHQLALVRIPEEKFRQLRAGLHHTGVAVAKEKAGGQFGPAENHITLAAPTYEEALLPLAGEAFVMGENSPLAQYVADMVNQIGIDFKNHFADILDEQTLDDITGRFADLVREGDPNARRALLDGLAEAGHDRVTDRGMRLLRDDWVWVDELVRRHLDQFQKAHARYRDQTMQPNTKSVPAFRREQNVRTRQQERSATLGGDLRLALSAESPMRVSQQLHFSSLTAPIRDVDSTDAQQHLRQAALLYESLAQGITRSELDQVQAPDNATGHALVMLERLVAQLRTEPAFSSYSQLELLSVVANLEVNEIAFDSTNGQPSLSGRKISFAQMALRQAVVNEMRTKQQIIDADPELAAKYDNWLRMTRPGSRQNSTNAERAFIEIIKDQQLINILGDEASILGPHLTVDQYLRHVRSLSPVARRREAAKLYNEGGTYVGRKEAKSFPYTMEDLSQGVVSSYRAVVDALINVANDSITIDKKGKLSGDYADRSEKVTQDNDAAHANVRQLLMEFLGIDPRKPGELTRDVIARALTQYPDLAQAVFARIPQEVATTVIQPGKTPEETRVANWVFDVFATADPREAEMILWRGIMMAKWNALGGMVTNGEINQDAIDKLRSYHNLDSRFLQVMYRMQHLNDGGLAFAELFEKLSTSTSLDTFFTWLNTKAEIIGDQAPLVPWYDDVADFSPDRANGGWSTKIYGTELRNSIRALQETSSRLLENVQQEAKAIEMDGAALRSVQKVLDYENGVSTERPTSGDRARARRLQEAADAAVDRQIGTGPAAMVNQIAIASWGFYIKAHNKGTNPPHVELAGALDTQTGGFGFISNPERFMASLTSVNLDDLGSNPELLAQDGVRSVDEHGRVVEWERPTLQQWVTLLQTPRTRNLGMDILFPQVLELTPMGASRQYLQERSITNMLDGNQYRDIFPKLDNLSREAAVKYLSTLEAEVGGHRVQRYLNKLVIVRLNAQRRPVTLDGAAGSVSLIDIVQSAMYEAAQNLQMAAKFAAQEARSEDSVVLEAVRKKAMEQFLKGRHMSELGVRSDPDEIVEISFDILASEMEGALEKEFQRAHRQASTQEEKTEVLEYFQNERERVELRIKQMKADDVIGATLEMFAIHHDDPIASVRQKDKLFRFFSQHLEMIRSATDLDLPLLSKLHAIAVSPDQRAEMDRLTRDEWDLLSRAAASTFVRDTFERSAPSRSGGLIPEDEVGQSYWDPNYGFLFDELWRTDSPLAQAAARLLTKANLQLSVMENDVDQAIDPETQEVDMDAVLINDAVNLISRTIWDPERVGPWTSDIPEGIKDAELRLNAAAAGPVIQMEGSATKRQSVISAATPHSWAGMAVPGDEHLSTATLTAATLAEPWSTPVEMQLAGAAPTETGDPAVVVRPMIQLNNRFVKTAVAILPDGTEINLLERPNVGKIWAGAAEVRDSGFVSVHLSRLGDAAGTVADEANVPLEEVRVQLQFLHPETQPASPEFTNSIFFVGDNLKFGGEYYRSPNDAPIFAPSGSNQMGQRSALDATKYDRAARKRMKWPTSGERQSMESGALQGQFAEMLLSKTMLYMEQDFGWGPLDPALFNAVYFQMRMRHWVRGRDESGNVVLLTADEVMAIQRAGEEIPLQDAELFIPSDNLLRSMLGEQGAQGEKVLVNDTFEVDPLKVKRFKGVTPQMLALVGEPGATVALEDTRVASRTIRPTMSVGGYLNAKDREGHSLRLRTWQEQAASIYEARSQLRRDGGFNPQENLTKALGRANQNLADTIDLSLELTEFFGISGPLDSTGLAATKILLRNFMEVSDKSNPNRSGWVFDYSEDANNRPQGFLGKQALTDQGSPGMQLAPGDPVVFLVDKFNGDETLAKKYLDFFMDQGASLILSSDTGVPDMQRDLQEYIESRQYAPVRGMRGTFVPQDLTPQYQNRRARMSTGLVQRGIRWRNRAAIALISGISVQENAALVVDINAEGLPAVKAQTNLVPTDVFGGSNVPVESLRGINQLEVTRQKLLAIDETDKGAALLEASLAGIQDKEHIRVATQEFRKAWDRLISRIKEHNTVLPRPGERFEIGDIVPLIDSTSSNFILYRHGHKAPPSPNEVRIQQDMVSEDWPEGMGVAIYSGVREPQASVHSGTLVSLESRGGALVAELDIPLSIYGDKKIVEFGGMKYMLTPAPEGWTLLPAGGIFKNLPMALATDFESTNAKEAFDDRLDNHQLAFALFGVNFLPDVTEFFFPGEGKNKTRQAMVFQWLDNLTRLPNRLNEATADELLSMRRLPQTFLDKLGTLPQMENVSAWESRLQGDSFEAEITKAILIYVMTNGSQVQDVMYSGGANSVTSDIDSVSLLMPEIFTQFFDRAPINSPLRTEMFARFNDQIDNSERPAGTGYYLNQSFILEATNEQGETVEVRLMVPELFSAGENAEISEITYDPFQRQVFSAHNVASVFMGVGATTAIQREIDAKRIQGQGHTFTEEDATNGNLWKMLTSVPRSDRSFARINVQSPAEVIRRRNAREAMLAFHHPLERDDDSLWDEYDQLAREILTLLHLPTTHLHMVDVWVRQFFGAPVGVDKDGNIQGAMSAKSALEMARNIEWNVRNHYYPTTGGLVSLMDVQHVQAIFRANRDRDIDAWSPRESLEHGAVQAPMSWPAWANMALGSSLASDSLFDPLFLLATDGFMHTYQHATRDMTDLPISRNMLVNAQLLDPNTSRELVSLSPTADQIARDPLSADMSQATFTELLGSDPTQRTMSGYQFELPPNSELAKRREQIRKWRLENDIPAPVQKTFRNFRENATAFHDNVTNTHTLLRTIVNMRAANALLNPHLWISFPFEVAVRNIIEGASGLVTGESTSAMGALRTKALEWLSDFSLGSYEAEDGSRTQVTFGDVLDAGGFTPMYSTDQIKRLRVVYDTMGSSNNFKGEIFERLMFQRSTYLGTNKVERFFGKLASVAGRWQDPTYGTRENVLARRYWEAAWAHISALPETYPISMDSLMDRLIEDPLFISKEYPEVHRSALNAIAQLRSLKPNPTTLGLRNIANNLSSHPNSRVANYMGNLLVRVPFMFATYAGNVATTMSGMQGIMDLHAFLREGSRKSTFRRKLDAMMSGKSLDEIPETYDMSEVIESMDLARSFIRGGMTHTGLFLVGSLLGGIASGEDEEDRRRRRAAELMGTPYVYDPRKVYNDWRNAEALYFKGIPYQMPWIAKQFISPMVGISRFLNNGDFREVRWGFEDALTSFPLINTMMWNDAVETAQQFLDQAKEADDGTDTGAIKSLGFVASAVATYERMLFENSFINTIYQNWDPYDRDPFARPLLDSDGNIQVDVTGEPRSSTALAPYIDSDGTVREGYVKRSTSDAQIHALTERNFTLAAALSLFTGGGTGSDYFRGNMPIKQRSVSRGPISREEVEASVLAAWQGTAPQQNLTTEEEINRMRNTGEVGPMEATRNLWAGAEARSEQSGMALAEYSQELENALDTEQARAVYRGLASGTLQLGAPELSGLYIPTEMRQQIQKDWMDAIIQEGVDMGLDDSKAKYRMIRLWQGPQDDPAVPGLGDILWSTAIPRSETIKYNQRNTAYKLGPDGLPWAVGFERGGNFLNIMGLNFSPLMEPDTSGFDDQYRGVMGRDILWNSVDKLNQINTGLRGLELTNETVMTEEEIGKSITDALEDLLNKTYEPSDPYASSGRGGGGGGGGGRGTYSGGYSNFIRMNPFPDQRVTYANSVPTINTSNPYIRRASIRRERVWSERGRLNQWQ